MKRLNLVNLNNIEGILINEGTTKYAMNVDEIVLSHGIIIKTTLRPKGGFLMRFE